MSEDEGKQQTTLKQSLGNLLMLARKGEDTEGPSRAREKHPGQTVWMKRGQGRCWPGLIVSRDLPLKKARRQEMKLTRKFCILERNRLSQRKFWEKETKR